MERIKETFCFAGDTAFRDYLTNAEIAVFRGDVRDKHAVFRDFHIFEYLFEFIAGKIAFIFIDNAVGKVIFIIAERNLRTQAVLVS